MTLLHQGYLVYTGVSTKNCVIIKIVGISWLSTDMILWNEKSIKTILGFNYWFKVLENFELFIFNFDI